MKTKRIEFEGITKQELHDKISALLNKYDEEIRKNNISVTKNGDTYSLNGTIKKFVFTFGIKADIELNEGFINVHYETDVPEGYHQTGIETLKSEIRNIQIKTASD